MVHPTFVDHLVFRVSDMERTERFYTAVLGPPSDRSEASLVWDAGETRLFFTLTPRSGIGPYDKEAVGLNHVAFGVRSLDALQHVAMELDEAGLRHSGIMLDHYGRQDFLWLDDPDGIRLEFYLRPQ